MKLSDRKKKGIIIVSLIFVAILAINTITDMFSANTAPSPSPKQPMQSRTNVQRQAQNLNVTHRDSLTASHGMSDFLIVNPFVDLNTLRTQQKEIREMASGNQGLPTIPAGASVPPPSVGSIPIPQLPTGIMPPPNASAGGKAKVSGILSGSEGNMAIMSDGQVVSVGDTYADGRIAYIGGDGIRFDDGHKLEYK